MARSSELLPTPLRPSTQVILPRLGRTDAAQRLRRAVVEIDARRQHGRPPRLPVERARPSPAQPTPLGSGALGAGMTLPPQIHFDDALVGADLVDRAFRQHRALVQHRHLARRARARTPCRARPRPPSGPWRCPAAARPSSSVSASVMPATGSSTSSSLGSCASSMPISSHCFWPCESAPASRWRCCGEADRVEDLVDARRAARRCALPEQVARARCGRPSAPAATLSSTVWFSNTVGFWNLRPMPSSAIAASSSLVRSTLPVEQHVAVVGPGLAGDDVHHRGLAGAVRADDGAHLAGRDVRATGC